MKSLPAARVLYGSASALIATELVGRDTLKLLWSVNDRDGDGVRDANGELDGDGGREACSVSLKT
jgi:hypothetical protein